MNERTAVTMGAVAGAVIGAAAVYLFFTDRGRDIRDRIEPAVGELRREFSRFQGTLDQLGRMASDGMRVVEEFNAARTQAQFRGNGGTH